MTPIAFRYVVPEQRPLTEFRLAKERTEFRISGEDRMYYTPGGFDNVTRAAFVACGTHPMLMSTRCHELAMYAIYESPFQIVADTPKAYEDQPTFHFINNIPGTWDEKKSPYRRARRVSHPGPAQRKAMVSRKHD